MKKTLKSSNFRNISNLHNGFVWVFGLQINKVFNYYKLILWFWWGWSRISKVTEIASLPCFYIISKKKVRDEVDFLHADKHQSYLQGDFNTLGTKVSYKVVLSLLMSMIKHSQSTQSNNFATSLQYLKKEVRNGV